MERKNLREHVRDLITLPINESPAISCYQTLSNGKLQDPNLYVQQMRSLRLGAGRTAWPEFDEGLARIQQYISGSLWADAKGMATFARGGEAPFFLPLQFRVALPNWISADTTPNIYHLVELKETYHRFVVMIATEESIRILQVNLGEVTAQCWEKCPELRKRVGREWTKTHYRRHEKERKRRFSKEAIRVLGQLLSAGGYPHFILAGHSSVASRIERQLPKSLVEKLVDTVPISGSAPLNDVVQTTLTSFIQSEEQQSRAAVDELLHELRSGGLAVTGARASIRALQRGQVDTLLLAKEYRSRSFWTCDRCGNIDDGSPRPEACHACGATSFRQSDARELIVRTAEEQDCRLEFVAQSDKLMHAGGVGCLLSYRHPDDFT